MDLEVREQPLQSEAEPAPQPYEAPELVRYGTVLELTSASASLGPKPMGQA